MKICFIVNTVFSLGGVQRVVSVLSSALSCQHDITILCADNKFKIDREMYDLSDNIKVEVDINIYAKYNVIKSTYHKVIRFMNKKWRCNFNPSILFKAYYNYDKNTLIRYLNENNFDVVIGVEGHFSILLGSISNFINAKTIGWQHNSYNAYFKEKNKYYWMQENLFKEYLNKLDQCIVLTKSDKEKYIDEFNLYEKCSTIYNPLSFESTQKSNCNNKEILFVGRLAEKQKGLDLLIDVFDKVRKKRKGWYLTIVGDGEDKYKLIKLISERGLEKYINIYNHTNNIEKFYVNASIFLLTSRWEGFGLVITEAMECALPVIAFRNSGPSEIIDNYVNGILVEKENVDEMVDKVIYLIDNLDERLRISKGAINRAVDFKITNIIGEWNKILNNVLQKK